MPVSLSPPRPPITCLSIQLCISPQTEFTIFASFWNPQAWLRGAVVEIIQVCSFTFFRGLSFHNYLFQQCCRIRELIGITSVLSENHVFVQPLEIAIEILSFFFFRIDVSILKPIFWTKNISVTVLKNQDDEKFYTETYPESATCR